MIKQTWPAERFFWAVIHAPGIQSARRMPKALLPVLQEELPIPAEDVHAVTVPLSDGNLLVCAARRVELSELAPATLSLSPGGVPNIFDAEPSPDDLNLLVGECEPRPLRLERLRRRALVFFTAAGLTCLMAVGLIRRGVAWSEVGVEATARIASLPKSPAVLHMELDRLRKAPRLDPKSVVASDASVALAALLSAWPKELECQTESVSIGPSTMSLSLTVGQDARPFLSALRAPEGWSLDEPKLTAAKDGAHLQLVLHRKEARP